MADVEAEKAIRDAMDELTEHGRPRNVHTVPPRATDKLIDARAGSVYLNIFGPSDKWISAGFMPPPGLAAGG